MFGLALLAVVAACNRILPTRLHPFRGGYYTPRRVPWFLHNALFYLVRYTFLPFVTLTPYGVWFLKAMGMKIGRHAFINTEYISDPGLHHPRRRRGDRRQRAHLRPLRRRRQAGGGAGERSGHRATLGLACCVMGDVVIGDDAVILPHSVLLPGSRVGAGETWGGVPARPVPKEEMEKLKRLIRGEAE